MQRRAPARPIEFVTPQERYDGGRVPILMQRHAAYTATKVVHPLRGRATRDWTRTVMVWLNPANRDDELPAAPRLAV